MRRALTGGIVTGLLLAVSPAAGGQDPGRQKQEEAVDYFERWLEETVVYIISPAEKSVFEGLTTDEEREQFIEQFWFRRDPDKRTAVNEFREEHYRRLAYVNEHFAAGWRGWETDRGRVYIIHGPPDEIEEHASGGEYQRTLPEGGGSTSTYPFQKWRYRHIDGLGSNVEIEFVDRDFSGVYRLALSPSEKDAFLHVPNAGFTAAEELGLATRIQRPYFTPSGSYPLMNYREQDSAFARYERFVDIQRPQQIEFSDLKQLIETDVSFGEVPLDARVDLFRLSDERYLAPVTLEIDNSSLTFERRGEIHVARAGIYGVITDIGNRLVTEFEDEVTATFSAQDFERGLGLRSAYSRLLLLDAGNRYKLQLIVKDLVSERVGSRALPIAASRAPSDQLSASPLVVSGYVAPAPAEPDPEQMWVLGDVVVRPSVTRRFSPQDYFAIYLQVYNVAVDQSTRQPSFRIDYRILRDDEVLLEAGDEVGESVQYFSPRRMVLIKRLPLSGLTPGRYRVEVAFNDRIASRRIVSAERFEIATDR